MDEEEIAMKIYQLMCADCPSAHRCHESCTNCDEYEDAIMEAMEENENAK